VEQFRSRQPGPLIILKMLPRLTQFDKLAII